MLILSAIIEGVGSRKDRTIKIVLGTQELSPEDAGELYKYSNDIVFVAFKKDNFSSEDKKILEGLKADDELELNTKSKAKRLRNVLYRAWEQKPEGFTNFKEYYEHKMERLITHYKNKLD